MRILVTNDDGINSDGLWRLAYSLTSVGEVSIVAPDRDRSGVGLATTLLDVIRVNKVASPYNDIDAISVEGTPSDCVILAIDELFDEDFDLIVSGVNYGSNLGKDILYSGTVGAAIHGQLGGIPSIAVSVESVDLVDYDLAIRSVASIANAVVDIASNHTPLVNINIPNDGTGPINGVCVTKPGVQAYLKRVEKFHEGRRTYYRIKHDKANDIGIEEYSDIWAIRNQLVSISSISLGVTDLLPIKNLQILAGLVSKELEIPIFAK